MEREAATKRKRFVEQGVKEFLRSPEVEKMLVDACVRFLETKVG